jgi:hypothetical protein
MKRFLVLMMVFSVMAVSQANVISNGSFETGDTMDWWTYVAEAENQTVTVVDTLASDDTYSIESYSATSTWSAQFGQYIEITPSVEGDVLTMTFDYYAVTDGWGSLGVNFDYYTDGKHWLGWTNVFNESSAPVEGEWTTVEITYDLPVGTYALDLKVEVANWATVNFDNFNATVPEPTTLTLLGLGGFLLARRRK